MRFVVDLTAKAYRLETAAEGAPGAYAVVEDGRRMAFRMSERTRVYDVQGFEPSGNACYILPLSPYQPWPSARLSLATADEVRHITVAGRRVSVEEVAE